MRIVIGCTPKQVAITITRLIKRRFPAADCIMVDNGAEFLFAVQKQHVDLCFIDLSLSIVSVEEIMTTLCYTPGLDKIRRVLICTISQQQQLRRLAVMGISGFLLKPLNIETATELIDKLVFNLKDLYIRKSIVPYVFSTLSKEPIFADNSFMMVVDDDEKFREFIKEIFAPTLRPVGVSNGAEALHYYMFNPQIKIMLVGAGQKLLHENSLAQKARQIAKDRPPHIYLCKEAKDTIGFDKDFKGALTKNYDKAEFIEEYISVVLKSGDKYLRIFDIIKPHILKLVFDELAKVFLAKTELNIYVIDRPYDLQVYSVLAEWKLTSSVHNRVLLFAICMPRDKMLAFADTTAGEVISTFEGVQQHLRGILEPVAEQLQTFLNSYGMLFTDKEFNFEEVRAPRELLMDWHYLVQTDRAERFVLRVMVRDALTAFFVG